MVITRHNGVVTNALQAWGYRVTAVTPTAPQVEPPVEEYPADNT